MRSYPAKPCRSGGCSCTFSRPNKVQDHQNFAGKLIGHRAKLTIPGPPDPIGTLIEETHTAKNLIASGGAAVTLHLPSFDLGSDFCGFQSGKPNTEPPVGAWFLPRISGQIGYPLLMGLPHHMQCRFHLYLGLSNAEWVISPQYPSSLIYIPRVVWLNSDYYKWILDIIKTTSLGTLKIFSS